MNDTRHPPLAEPMTRWQVQALRIVGDGWVRAPDADAHGDADGALARSIARSRALQRMLDDESARLTPLVVAAAEQQLEDMVQGVRRDLAEHFERRCRALESAMLAIVDALLDDPRALVELVVSMTQDHVADSLATRVVLELPGRFEGQGSSVDLIEAHAWDAVEYHPSHRVPTMRIEHPGHKSGFDSATHRQLIDADALRTAIRQSFRQRVEAAAANETEAPCE